MKRHLAIITLLLINILPVYAGHISGGEIYYRYIGPGTDPNTDRFTITLRLFKDRNDVGTNIAAMPTQVTLTVFAKISESAYRKVTNLYPVARTALDVISITPSAYPCIIPTPKIDYEVGYYEKTIDLAREPFGYTVAFQTCCRANNITNMQGFQLPQGNNGDGATYVATISGTTMLAGQTNSSPQFKVKDTAVVCSGNRFELDFGAIDPDPLDSLSYSFISAYDRGDATGADATHEASLPPFKFITYTAGFSGTQPLGTGVSIDPVTGLITGIAPDPGKYVINVYVVEYRNQVKIGEHRKDFILQVKSCNVAAASLSPGYITCDGYNLSFENLSTSPLVQSWYWDFGVAGTDTDVSTDPKPTYTFPSDGDYTVKLVVNRNQQCSDSITTVAKVYPGFFPGFRVDGSCILRNFNFIDTSKTAFGTINKWTWKFGDETSTTDASTAANPTWKYSTTGYKQVECIIQSSKGCIDTITLDSLEVRDKPLITMAFRDTLICSQDTLRLHASGRGSFSWTPTQSNILLFSNTPDPDVFPKTTSLFNVTLDDNGCVNTDSVKVRVVDYVTLDAGADKIICLTDTVILNPSGDGLYFKWTPVATLDNATKKNPAARPVDATTTYTVLASISNKCTKTDDIKITAVPYPKADAGKDVVICYDDTTRLIATMDGLRFNWTPQTSLIDGATLTPYAFPLRTTSYVFRAYDDKGCPKPGIDTVVVTVRPEIIARAGNDTSIVAGQPLLLNGSGADLYDWTPSTGLNRTDLKRPTAILSDNMTYILKAYTAEQCYDYDTINVKVFKTIPDIFVPNAFTPGKATNARFRPIPVGIATLSFFRVFNRWGQLMYSSINTENGWDGKFNGRDQDQGTYVWMVKGQDYLGQTVFKKGTVVLIR